MIDEFIPAEPLEGTKFSEYKNKILITLKRNSGYCPCNHTRSIDTLCPCKIYRETKKCECHLYEDE